MGPHVNGSATGQRAKAVIAPDSHPSMRTERSDISAASSSGKKGSYSSQAKGRSGNAMEAWIQQSPRDDPWSVAARFGSQHADMPQGQEAKTPKKNQDMDEISLGGGTFVAVLQS